jgi:flagellar motor switch protein FliG
LSKMMQGLSGRQKAAILLITLGPEVSAQIFKHLREEEIEQLTLEIANVRKVDSMDRETILAEFHQICMAQEYITQGGITYAKDILEKALGEQKALEVINRLTATLQVRPFDFARTLSRTRMPRRSRWSCRICKPSNPRIFCRRCLRRNKPRWRGELR